MAASLHGKRILITREENQAKVFSEMVLQHDGIPVEVPLLKISCKGNVENYQLMSEIHQYHWVFFTSANGVHCFFQVLNANGISSKSLLNCHIAAVGHKTDEALQEYGISADFIPSTYNADVMAEEFFAGFSSVSPALLVRGNRSRDVLPEEFTKMNIAFDTIEVYETTYNLQSAARLNMVLIDGDIDFITFTSPSSVDAFNKLINEGKSMAIAKKIVCVCIGTTTERRANELGFNNTIIPKQFTVEGMVHRIIDYIMKGQDCHD